jgi:pyridoxal-phosphate dependent enzyme
MTLGDFQVTDALAKTREFGAQPGYFAPQQFDSERNVEENRTWLGPEVRRQLPAGVLPDAVVGGVGTGGTIVGEEPGPTGVTSEARPAPSTWVPAPASRPTRVRADPSHCPHISAADDDLARPKRCAPIRRYADVGMPNLVRSGCRPSNRVTAPASSVGGSALGGGC